MISLELLAKHMAWANQEIYKEIKKLDPEVLNYYVVDREWTVRTIMVHIVTASYLYSQRLQEKPFSKIEFDIEDTNLIDNLLSALESIDRDLIEQVYKDDKEVTFETSKGERSEKISVILSMMIFHATEHRAQIVAALDKNDERSINLDEYSIFGYLRENS
ncbi:MAG: hypothetical protein CL518_01175 [Actinobacteria bacterium]|nr:hypothetical protein [Actinomycetota bacterium]|tara:strand:- start:1057 stop:1539 length:483 start_codon:yes stop_codon:yes gene_type:complete